MSIIRKEDIEYLNKEFRQKSAEEVLVHFLKLYGEKITFSTSLGAEDQVLTHMIAGIKKDTRIFTLDTGRVFQETYDLIDETRNKYGLKIETYFPDSDAVEKMTSENGVNLFYHSIENRKLCCNIRKKEPLKRAFKGAEAWICGLRREQAVTRFATQMVEWDEQHQMIKINPLIHWTEEETWDYIKKHKIPYNKLHDKGFPSIGCLPCTRAIEKGEDTRAGRWWWEQPESKECGLHINDK